MEIPFEGARERLRDDFGELIAGLLFVGLREKFAEVGECEAFRHRCDATEWEIGVLEDSRLDPQSSCCPGIDHQLISFRSAVVSDCP